ncbi:cubilin-like isoform X2 [Gigantopelta aegis]|uniref:cubilin-like isoform X2 n=1 Tax=Gigantopelta aegis TaxID=1735272 RepID=UPI001B88A4D7|nr:cubilin-like isoform X2 [Gigantopelta aegis]
MDTCSLGFCLLLTGSLVCLLVSADEKTGCDVTCYTNNTSCSFTLNQTHPVAGMNCTWKLIRVNGTETTLIFTEIGLYGEDQLLVYDGVVNETNLVTTIHGKKNMFVGVMFKQNTTMVFQKKNNNTSKLNVQFTSKECVLNFWPKFSAQVVSPVYLPARGDVLCKYVLNGWKGITEKVLDLSFTSFSLLNGSITATGGKTTVTLKGSNLPDDIISLTRKLTLEMKFPNAAKKSFFEGFYSIVDKECSQTLVINDTLTLSLDMGEGQYPITDCRWLLTTAAGRTLTINVTRLELALGADRLIITDGGSINSRVLAQMVDLTSGGAGDLVISSGQSVMVRLVMGAMPQPRHIRVTVKSTVDGSHLYTNGTVSLKTQKTNRTSSKFYYQFSSPAGLQAQVVLDAFSNQTLLYPTASISFYDGLQLASPLLVKFVSITPFFPVTASGNSLLMVAENFSRKQNFTAVFSSILKGCNAIGSGFKGSYSLGSDVPPGQQCRWTIPARQKGDGDIIISPRQLLLQVNQTVTIYSGVLENGKPLRKFSRKSSQDLLPQISVPVPNGAELVFESRNKCTVNCTQPVVTADFAITTKACGRALLTSSSGQLSSPNFPNQYPLNSDCTWLTQSNKTRLFYLSFTTFRLSKGHKFEIRKLVNATTKTVASFSGNVLPQDVLIPRNMLSLQFSAPPVNRSQTSKVDQGFTAKYMLLDCGGRLTELAANISSPRKWAGVCVWIVSIPLSSKKGSLRNIVQFTVSSSKDKTGLVFHDGASASSPLLPVKVTKGHSGKILSRNNTLFIMYQPKSSGKVTFKIQYSTFSCNKTTQCDGGMCMHPDWRCDGLVQCTDGKDELNCNGTTIHTSTGVKTFWVPVCLIIGIILGIVFAIVIPAVYRRIKYPNYRELRDQTAPVST